MTILLILLAVSLLSGLGTLHAVRRDSRGWRPPPASRPADSRLDALARP